MDPVGPWSAYASYNRLAGVQAGSGSGELHHHSGAGTPTTTAQLLTAGGFLSPPPVGYETVFSPLFHHAPGAKPSHYVTQVTQHRAQALVQTAQTPAASKQNAEGEYHQTQAFFEQGGTAAWQQNSPFGILPHESVVATTTSKTTPYENFNPHFAAQSLNHLNTQLAVANAKSSTRSQSPQVSTASSKSNVSQSNSSTFYQVPVTYSGGSDTASNAKAFTTNSNLQQSCIVSSTPTASVSKEYRVPQAPTRTFLSSPNPPPRQIEKNFSNKQNANNVQTKNQNQNERQRSNDEQSQSSPISFSMIDSTPGRVSYTGSNSSAKRPTQFQQHANYRHYQQQNATNEQEFQRPKSGSDYSNSNGPDCNVVVPRRPSPHQAHSQASPLGHAQSPAYPMYNSPMSSSISSPQQNSSNQVTPPSPLDVSVPRPNSQNNNVAYPSVITRALNSEKNYPERYERPNQPQQNNQTQNCWDERQNRKFPTNQYNNSTNNVEIVGRQIDIARNAEPQQRSVGLNISERQQAYFDTTSGHTVTLQDLSSCRGDPMSLVKNLQQQSCQVPQPEIKQEVVKQPAKRRKSNEKTAASVPATTTEPPGRIPPPAHSSGGNQQQQNGAYFDFDRWNLAPPPAKLFTTQGIHQQHQGLMVPHPHGHHPPPLPYFTPFHLGPPPQEFQSTEIAQPAGYNVQSPQPTTSQFVQQEDQPKVVVPNIEEELNFLSEGPPLKSPSVATNSTFKPTQSPATVAKALEKPAGPGAGFMSSYLKFLQGERDSSPPPASRTSRKQNWSRTSPPAKISQPDESKVDSNGIPPPPPVIVPPPPPPVITRLSQGDPQDDPRYFPLPKERKRDSFDSSDDGFSSEDDFFPKVKPQTQEKKTVPKENKLKVIKEPKEKPKKVKSLEAKEARESKKLLKQQEALLKKQAKEKLKEEKQKEKKLKQMQKKLNASATVPRRESAKRAAKERKKTVSLNKDDDIEEPPEFQDSDSDPAWTPKAKDDADDDMVLPKTKKKGPGRKGKTRNLITAAAEGAGIKDYDGYSSDGISSGSKRIKSASKSKQSGPPTLEDNIAASLHSRSSILNDDNPFKPGEFVVIKSDLKQEWPPIWRVDGKTLLQKYEPFEQDGITLYRNISTYTSWSPESKKQYMSVPVKFKSQSQLETIVEFLKSEVTIIDHDFQEKCMKTSELYQDNFEVYIQTLISQALDNNFLTEIFQEQDDYFLSNVKTIDDITESKKNCLLAILRWPASVQAAVCTWPCFNIIREVNLADGESRTCAACSKMGVAVRVLMYGQPYNSTTLEGCQPDQNAMNEKDFLMCRICANRVELMNKVTHQKYLMYIECAKRVSEKRAMDPNKDTTCILNELLADENWLNQLFLEVRTCWSEVDCIEHSYKVKNSSVQ
ncbi:hypothetical protein WA026_006423 [Henosepilachna vigintioctopunctata]|uniref:DUF4211 domain-containing protein n=1 Tax=Henosepilachna vigintioctopunctata TaxID=420089 RepID=A0AAW1TKF4_9CUCU